MNTTERKQFEADLFHTWQRRATTAEAENIRLRKIIQNIAPIFSQRLEEVLASLERDERRQANPHWTDKYHRP